MKSLTALLPFMLSVTLVVAQDKPYTASYIVEWGNRDTIAIETFTLYENLVYGKAVHGFPENYVRSFDIQFDSSGSIRELNYLYHNVSNTSLPILSETGYLPFRFSAKLADGLLDFKSLKYSETLEESGLERIVHQTDGYHFNGDWIPILAQFEWLVEWFIKQDKSKVEGLKFINAYVGVFDLQLELISKHHIRFWSNISEAIEIYLDEDRRISSIDAIGSVWNVNVHRVDPVDIEHYTDRFKSRPTMGNPSPRLSISQKINNTNISIDYGRPSKRGRKIFGHIVPYGDVWRTGAGAATTISFENDMYFDGQRVIAGTYNVYSLPNEDNFTLILNSKLDSWGSVYLSEFDVAHLPMEVVTNSNEVEKFTINVVENDRGGDLELLWDRFKATIKLTDQPY